MNPWYDCSQYLNSFGPGKAYQAQYQQALTQATTSYFPYQIVTSAGMAATIVPAAKSEVEEFAWLRKRVEELIWKP